MAALPPEAEAVLSRRSEAIGKIHEDLNARKADLYDKYAAALEREVRSYRQSGDLDNLLIVTNEQKAAREKRETMDGQAPVLVAYRKTLQEELAKYEFAVDTAVKEIDRNAVKTMTALRTQLTQAGSVDAAVAVDEQIKAIDGALASAGPAVGDITKLQAPEGKVPTNAMFKGEEPWVGNFVLEPKRHLLRERIVLGREGRKDEDQRSYPANVFTTSGCRLENGEIFLDQGLMKSTLTHFSGTALRVDLGGQFEAIGCLFEGCSVGKGGAWFVNLFSSKWVFENCVFTGSFVRDWKVGQVGVKVQSCSFFDVNFSPIVYKEDAGDEVKREWMEISNCHFVNCKVPESLLVTTRDCLFEDCEFLQPDGEMKIKTPIKTRMFVTNKKSLPVTGQMRVVEVVELPQGKPNVGAALKFRRAGKSLSFSGM